jgi:hypothetical protein
MALASNAHVRSLAEYVTYAQINNKIIVIITPSRNNSALKLLTWKTTFSSTNILLVLYIYYDL